MQLPSRIMAGVLSALAVLGGAAAPIRAGVNPDLMLSAPAARVGPAAMATPGKNGTSLFRPTPGASLMAAKVASTRQVTQSPDLNGDGNLDILFQHAQTGQVYYWLTDGTRITADNFLWAGNIAGWRVISTADLNRDGYPDVLLRNETSGAVNYWLTDGTRVTAQGSLTAGGNADYAPFEFLDLSGDNRTDVLLENKDTGEIHYWVLANGGKSIGANGVLLAGQDPDDGADSPWRVATTGDLNGDRRLDVVRRNRNTGAIEYILLGSAGGVPTITARGLLWEGGDAAWALKSMPDLNADGTPDALFQYAGTDAVYYWILGAEGTSIATSGYLWSGDDDPATSWRFVAASDLDGDGGTEILFQNTLNGAVYFWDLVNGGTAIGADGYLWAGGDPAWAALKVFDMNRDGFKDLIFRRSGTNAADPNRGAIYYWRLTTGPSIASHGFLWAGGDANWLPVEYYPDSAPVLP